jgi:hypothetical protein
MNARGTHRTVADPMHHPLCISLFIKNSVQVLIAHFHEEYGWVILEIRQQRRPRALRRGLYLSDDVVFVGRLDEPAFLTIDGHAVVGCSFSIYSALFISIVYFHHTPLSPLELTHWSALIACRVHLSLPGRPALALIKGTCRGGGSMCFIDFDGDVE